MKWKYFECKYFNNARAQWLGGHSQHRGRLRPSHRHEAGFAGSKRHHHVITYDHWFSCTATSSGLIIHHVRLLGLLQNWSQCLQIILHCGRREQVEAQLKCPGAGYNRQPVITGCLPGKMASPKWPRSSSESERKLLENMFTTCSLMYIHLIFIAYNIEKCFWFTI